MTVELVDDLESALSAVADSDAAVGMRAYQRDRFDFLGVKTPERRRVSAELLRTSRAMTVAELTLLVDELRARRQREFHYVASDVLRANDRRLPPSAIIDVRRWIQTDAWWDTVDAIASPTVGTMVRHHPELAAVMDEWVDEPDIWLARTAIIHQLRFGDATDEGRLFDYSLRRAADREFFIRKAIGWALRQYARTAPAAVRSFVDAHEHELQPLSVREATKHLR